MCVCAQGFDRAQTGNSKDYKSRRGVLAGQRASRLSAGWLIGSQDLEARAQPMLEYQVCY
eukprot:1161339-Pelagomonas_calceolata.AAC.8